jgi:hypothetical protein
MGEFSIEPVSGGIPSPDLLASRRLSDYPQSLLVIKRAVGIISGYGSKPVPLQRSRDRQDGRGQ